MLKEMEDLAMQSAHGKIDPGDAARQINAIKTDIVRFYDTTLFGSDCRFRDLYPLMELVDGFLSSATEEARAAVFLENKNDGKAADYARGQRDKDLKSAKDLAGDLQDELRRCTDGDDAAVAEAASNLRARMAGLTEDETLTPEDMRRSVKYAREQKLKILEGRYISNCAIAQYYTALEDIDIPITDADSYDFILEHVTVDKAVRPLRRRITQLSKRSAHKVKTLRKVLLKIPCDPTDGGSGGGGDGDGDGGGGTTSQCVGSLSGAGTATATITATCDHETSDTSDDMVYDVAIISGDDSQRVALRAPNAQSCGPPAGWFGGQLSPPNQNGCGFFQTSGTPTAGPHTFTVTWASAPAAVSMKVSQGQNGTPVPVKLTPH